MRQILIVDDERDISEVVSVVVSELGYGYDLANNGQEALDYLKEKEYDLVITDMMMPVMDGRNLILAIRNEPKLAQLPILLFSAYLNVHDVKDLLDIGVTYFIGKPVEIQELMEYIERALKK